MDHRYEVLTFGVFLQILLSLLGIFVVLPIVAVALFGAIGGVLYPVCAPFVVLLFALYAIFTKTITVTGCSKLIIGLFVWGIVSGFVWGTYIHGLSFSALRVRPICETIQLEKSGNTVFIYNEGNTVIDEVELWVIGNGETAQFGHIYQKQTGSYTYRTMPLFLGVMYLKGHVKGVKVQGPCIYREKQ